MSRVAGVRKVVLLTLWLLMPLAIVALLMWFIFASFQAGPAMDARAVGQGARDTGGANAIGEMLAGNDPDARQAEQRSLRAGERVDEVAGSSVTIGEDLINPFGVVVPRAIGLQAIYGAGGGRLPRLAQSLVA